MSKLTQDDILKILTIMDKSSFDELHLKTGDIEFTVRKKGITNSVQEVGPSISDKIDSTVVEEPVLPARNQSLDDTISFSSDSGLQKTEPATIPFEEERFIPIKANMMGTFYRSARPGVPPFVEVGTFVTEEDIVCILEVMKVMNTLNAGVQGRIVKICVENGQLAEYNQTLFLVEPESTQKKI